MKKSTPSPDLDPDADYADRVFYETQTVFNRQVATGLEGVAVDVAGLNIKIRHLQDSPGRVSIDDQATIDELQAAGKLLADKVTALAALKAPAYPNPPPELPVSPVTGTPVETVPPAPNPPVVVEKEKEKK
jgi:hypothetical protein